MILPKMTEIYEIHSHVSGNNYVVDIITYRFKYLQNAIKICTFLLLV